MPRHSAYVLFFSILSSLLFLAGICVTGERIPIVTRAGYANSHPLFFLVVLGIGAVLLLKQKISGFLFFLLPGLWLAVSAIFRGMDGQVAAPTIVLAILALIVSGYGWSLRIHFLD